MTWSPFRTDITVGPTSTTTPAPSWPRIAGNSPSGSAPDSVNSSVWQMPVALISTITSPALGPSSCTVSIWSGLPAWNATAARTSIAILRHRPVASIRSLPQDRQRSHSELTLLRQHDLRLCHNGGELAVAARDVGLQHN